MGSQGQQIVLCDRCGDIAEYGIQSLIKYNNKILKLTLDEAHFIKTKHTTALCLACQNQLKTSYKIKKGNFNDAAFV